MPETDTTQGAEGMEQRAIQAEDALVDLLKHCTAFPGCMEGEPVENALAVAHEAERIRYPNVVGLHAVSHRIPSPPGGVKPTDKAIEQAAIEEMCDPVMRQGFVVGSQWLRDFACAAPSSGGVTREELRELLLAKARDFARTFNLPVETKLVEFQVDAILTRLQSAREEERPITMQDVRLRVGEGKLTPADVLVGCNAELAARARLSPRSGEEAQLRALREIKLTALTETNSVKVLHHIVRLCIDAGVTETLAALRPASQGEEVPR